jgi:predicted site-specific integrase-resolvase
MSEARRYYYARVSSQSQNLDRQIEAFKKLGASDRDIVIISKVVRIRQTRISGFKKYYS